jgi:hypothetical protein
MVRPEAPAGPEDMRGEEAPSPTPAQPEREDAAVDSPEPITPPTHRVSVREAARNLETSVEVLLDAKDQTIADLRDRVAFLERQLEGRGEEIRRRDHIFAALTERIPPAIEAPDHEKPTRTPESTAEELTRATPVRAGPSRGARGVRGGAARSGDSYPPRSRGKTGSLPEQRGCAIPWTRTSEDVPSKDTPWSTLDQ